MLLTLFGCVEKYQNKVYKQNKKILKHLEVLNIHFITIFQQEFHKKKNTIHKNLLPNQIKKIIVFSGFVLGWKTKCVGLSTGMVISLFVHTMRAWEGIPVRLFPGRLYGREGSTEVSSILYMDCIFREDPHNKQSYHQARDDYWRLELYV